MIDNTYTFQEIIGFGGSSKVFSVTDNFNETYAMKAIRKDRGYDSEVESMMVLREYLVMDHVGEHPNIIKHFACNSEGLLQLEDQHQTISYNLMEFCENGSLSNVVKKTGAIEENLARFMFTQLSAAVKHLHDRKFAHLDIKLENTLLDKFFNIKLGDFGSGVSLVKTQGYTTHKVGTPLYMAPEIKNLAKGQSFDGLKADIYSLGVTLCLMLLGELPDSSVFQSERSTVGSSQPSESDEMSIDGIDQSCAKIEYLSQSSRDLLALMLNEDPTERPSIDEVLAHKWISGESFEGIQELVYSEMNARIEEINGTFAF